MIRTLDSLCEKSRSSDNDDLSVVTFSIREAWALNKHVETLEVELSANTATRAADSTTVAFECLP